MRPRYGQPPAGVFLLLRSGEGVAPSDYAFDMSVRLCIDDVHVDNTTNLHYLKVCPKLTPFVKGYLAKLYDAQLCPVLVILAMWCFRECHYEVSHCLN